MAMKSLNLILNLFYEIGGQVQFDESIAQAQDWMQRYMSQPLTTKQIAQHCGLPLRSFNRKF